MYINTKGMELSASNPYAVLGKPFTLTCRWRVRPFPGWWISFDWFWTSKEDRMYHDQIFKNFSIPIGIYLHMYSLSFITYKSIQTIHLYNNKVLLKTPKIGRVVLWNRKGSSKVR